MYLECIECTHTMCAESHHEIRCDVLIDKIARLDVVTRTKYLYLDDPFQVLSLAAFDEKGLRRKILVYPS